MPFVTLSSDLVGKFSQQTRLIASDMDGTLTRHGKFTPALLQALNDLAIAGVDVMIVTGRSAGWVSGLVSYLPVVGAIAENGGLFYPANQATATMLVDIPDILHHRQQLAQMFQRLQTRFPQLQESDDNRFRITDWTFDVFGLSAADLQDMNDRCRAEGWSFTYSNVQCHIKPLQQDKANGLEQVMRQLFPECEPTQILTVGDSPNDESLFNSDRFPLSIGVANVKHYAKQMTYLPTYVTQSDEVEGFCELAQAILTTKATTNIGTA